MKRILLTMTCASLLAVTGQAFAGDASSAQHQQMMKDCVKQHKAQNSGMSERDVKKACEEQLRMSDASSTPNQTTPTTTGERAPQSGSESNPPTNPPK